MLSLAGMAWMVSLLFTVMVTCPCSVQAVFGIPEFLEMGTCTTVPLMVDFDPVKYSGVWFDIESVPNEYQHTKKCVTQNYTWMGDYMNVNTRGLTSENKKVRQGAIMRVEKETVKQPNPAHMTVDAAGVPAAPYQIVSSDYRTYSCVYSCLEYFGFRAEFFWVFGRTPVIPTEKIKICHNTFKNLGVDYKKMVPIVQGEVCPYNEKLPEILRENEQYLFKVLGPYVSTSTVPIPSTTPTPETPKSEIDEELREIKELVEEEKELVKELETKVVQNTKVTLQGKKGKAPGKDQAHDEDLNSASSSTPAVVLLLLPVFLTTLLHH